MCNVLKPSLIILRSRLSGGQSMTDGDPLYDFYLQVCFYCNKSVFGINADKDFKPKILNL